jgi:hypothetical protein
VGRVVVADDSFLLREGLERLLASVPDLDVVGSCPIPVGSTGRPRAPVRRTSPSACTSR